MKKSNKTKTNKLLTIKDYIYMIIISLSFILFVLILCGGTHYYGSTLDWYAEHVSIPEYFRTLFYHTHDLFPDLALNIGNGQNIYNLSYYGLLSPIILISYLLPKVSMVNYIIISTIILVIISANLLYLFLKHKNLKSETCLIACLAFIFSSPISFHSHRHIMFINYMPFLILGLFGIDKVFDKNHSWLLIISTFLMIMTSYYYSVGGIVCLFIYGLYRYLKQMKKVTFKTFFKAFFKVLGPIMIAIFMSTIITLPTLAAIINNRAPSNVTINLKNLLLPNLTFRNVLFYYYGLGLTSIIIPAIIHLFTKEKSDKILALILTLLGLFNIFNYLLNGTMYIDAKSLIPFLPLYILVLAYFINDLIEDKVRYQVIVPFTIIISIIFIISNKTYLPAYLIHIIILFILIIIYHKFNKKLIITIPLIIIFFITGLYFSHKDTLELKYTNDNNESIVKNLIESVTELDQDMYRISNNIYRTDTPNKIYENINYYNSTIYSSISNQKYNHFFYNTAMNNLPTRNRALTVTSPNILYLLFSNNKYYITDGLGLIGYEKINSKDGIYVYKNEQVLPFAYASSNIMSYEDFNKLSHEAKQEALLNVIVADAKTENDYISNIHEMHLDLDKLFNNENITKEADGSYTVKSNDSLKLKYELPDEYKNKILFIRFKMNRVDKNKDLAITINTVKNKLTNKKWKYYNGNTTFNYVLAFDNQEKLNIHFSEGKYNISDFELYYLDYAHLEKISTKFDPLIVDKETTKGDFINGHIKVREDGYFTMSIPYDNGYKVKVDNNEVKLEKVNETFIGFKIKKGEHQISIEYKAPLKELSLWTSLLGLIAYIIVIYIESKRKI